MNRRDVVPIHALLAVAPGQAMPDRTRLPNRRLCATHTLNWNDCDLWMGVGYDTSGRAREVFLNGHKVGSEIEAMIQDACVLVSLHLQRGLSAAALARHLGREGTYRGATAASLIGLVAEGVRRPRRRRERRRATPISVSSRRGTAKAADRCRDAQVFILATPEPAMRPDDPTLTGGGRFAMVPAELLVDRRISRSARWLFSMLCGHANKASLCRIRLRSVADAEQVTVRAVQYWLKELEAAGRVARHAVEGKTHVYRVIRDPAAVPAARVDNKAAIDERRAAFTPPPRPAVEPVENPVDTVAAAAETREAGGEPPFTPPVNHSSPQATTAVKRSSPPSEQESTVGVQQLSGPDPGTSRRASGDARARQSRASRQERPVKAVDRHQPAMLMPIKGGKSAEDSASGEGGPIADPGLELILRLILSAVERLLALNRDGRLSEAEIHRVIGEITHRPPRSAAGEEGS